jgi:hypothetical protein
VQNNHIGIISKDTFTKAQQEITRRKSEQLTIQTDKTKYSSKYPFSSKLICPCGAKFRRFSQTFINSQNQKQEQIVWVCTTHQKDKTLCNTKPIKQETVEQSFVTALNSLVANKEQFTQ